MRRKGSSLRDKKVAAVRFDVCSRDYHPRWNIKFSEREEPRREAERRRNQEIFALGEGGGLSVLLPDIRDYKVPYSRDEYASSTRPRLYSGKIIIASPFR